MPPTPPIDVFLSTWRADPVTIGALLVASVVYLGAVARMRRRGESWPVRRTVGFFALGLLPYAVIELGFLGVFSAELRWAFSTRIALLIFVIPAGVAAGRPLDLLPAGVRERLLASRLTRIFGNAMVATVVIAAVFCLFLTPLAGILRVSPVVEASLGIVVPLMGLAMVLPMTALGAVHTGTFIAIEFLLAFVELLIDSVPGLLMRLNDSVLDLVPDAAQALSWWPSTVHDQHLAGDMIWFIAEFADVPILVILMIRWMRSDRVEAKAFDDLSDELYEEMTRAHLHGER
ncbi:MULTISPECIES: cytochrome c oxidase assembly protein [Microbacterium]|uniref:cytochrome c oxidase assembly protein n=1 Tax=Microbacterium TaxID=33882 RepID=UPI0027896507|nr:MULTISPECIES: cytochrome c oxidase assembly protein [Microbacterium]MDQ1083727.1 putative membrane protein [Microbacterium sp. SORGH_AS_0344]MDQ1170995.1 putative membrane protein [Microbacterium proteolyticum]